MKVNIKKREKTFNPLTVEMTFESIRELESFTKRMQLNNIAVNRAARTMCTSLDLDCQHEFDDLYKVVRSEYLASVN